MDNNDLGVLLDETIRSYFTDYAFRAGVDSLLMFSVDDIPQGEKFSKLGEFYRARATAELTRYDFAALLHGLWSRVWGALLHDWSIADDKTLRATNASFSVSAIWKDRSLTTCHVLEGRWFYSSVAVDEEAVKIGFSLEGEAGPLTKVAPDFIWHDDEDWAGWLVHTSVALIDPKFDVVGLIAVANTGFEDALRHDG